MRNMWYYCTCKGNCLRRWSVSPNFARRGVIAMDVTEVVVFMVTMIVLILVAKATAAASDGCFSYPIYPSIFHHDFLFVR